MSRCANGVIGYDYEDMKLLERELRGHSGYGTAVASGMYLADSGPP